MSEMVLLRDENGEPVMELRTRDSWGQFTSPYYAYIWVEAQSGGSGG